MFWAVWALVTVCSYAVPLVMAWSWLNDERQAALASGNSMWASTDTPPILAILASCFAWTLLLVIVHAALGTLWLLRRWRQRRQQQRTADQAAAR